MNSKKKILFLDRDGTLIVEPPEDFQVDSLEKLQFVPKVITALHRVVTQSDYLLVMVTNQDGLGTQSFPEDTFWPAHQKMMQTFEQEGIRFFDVHIDRTFEHENAPTRKPRTGLLTHYMESEEYDLAASFVVGDRLSDVQLAANLGCQAILYTAEEEKYRKWKAEEEALKKQYPCLRLICNDWYRLADYVLMHKSRRAQIHRQTNETDIVVALDLDTPTEAVIQTGIPFFDHMLHQLARHAAFGLQLEVKGDLEIDEHHTIEDTALALGQAFVQALGKKWGIRRYGHFLLPMDETIAQVAVDFSGRPYLNFHAQWHRERVGGMPTEMVKHFFASFCHAAQCNLYMRVEGENDHHQIEALFKAWARAMRMAVEIIDDRLPSTKGTL
ncbi:bifunctional histidinol-phosphatase/imidazoleglycerol-phosphate dehydratase HisB [Thermonema rossianum]|uniref:bifunctional histidinol-phosphatase/imidazoleglycerol-phosphate dehydratase HisB n=1 Tax=Thermonema rossianum TaxID=55505 RepID=UPI00056F3A05|nr:bifunctional histidinol-phosphatase/imidazoleglycerol-phosphate dehydratase HisB [Thermonema rossianum]